MTFQDFPIPIGLAPMDGVTDLPVRMWLAITSRFDFAITPFLRVTQDYPLHRIPSTFCPDSADKRFPALRPQLMGSCPKTLARFSVHLLEQHPVVDLNFGCPAPRVVGNRAGSALIEDHAVLRDFLNIYFENIPPRRISLKTRLGFFEAHEAHDLLSIFNDFPLHSLTLHGRTREQRYRGSADWQAIDCASQKARFPVVASGDILSNQHFQAFLKDCPHAQGLLIGRGLLRNPWLLWEIRAKEPVSLDAKVIPAALRVAAQLFDAIAKGSWNCAREVVGQALEGQMDGRQYQTWTEVSQSLTSFKDSQKIQIETSTSVLPRLKMLWNYLRTSLPSEWDDPNLLRTKTADDFFDLMNEKANSFGSLRVEHRPLWDWRFSGEIKPV